MSLAALCLSGGHRYICLAYSIYFDAPLCAVATASMLGVGMHRCSMHVSLAVWLASCASSLAAMSGQDLLEVAPPKRHKRPQQDYAAWPHFGTRQMWGDILDNPLLAAEILCRFANSLGLVAPLEPTAASLAGGIMVATYGKMAPLLPDAEVRASVCV
jgi:hypothetical protein